MTLRRFGVSAAALLITTALALPQTATAGTQVWDFEDGASDWSAPNGTWEASGGVYSEVSGADPAMHSVVGDDSWDDYVVSTKVRFDEGDWAGIAFRVMSDFEYYVYYLNLPDNKSELWQHTDGAFDSRVNIADIPGVNILIEEGVMHDVQVVAEGENFELWIDGELQSSQSNSDYATGKVGVWTWATMASFDDFTVTGDGIDGGTAVEPRDKLASVWGDLKDTR
ncbi:hypothetical protein HN371_06415 [Candidatus Poribacteria bacterium]|jgi:pectate lyase|nr:hypothetical protein [Candidatus Poribacteria bacterium]MBT5533406.1 hypothetical protein [Candidatus Poribacteria bacterium]MBT5715049.1 hypothetical protein [Candidatus Poribacteria bacterium]MBT7100032.1 hypothetical protein [Candidatus Poribacteria bacterium]MBT7806758.1 hypothetical protein [Candidatus Poribacteria bacterium]